MNPLKVGEQLVMLADETGAGHEAVAAAAKFLDANGLITGSTPFADALRSYVGLSEEMRASQGVSIEGNLPKFEISDADQHLLEGLEAAHLQTMDGGLKKTLKRGATGEVEVPHEENFVTLAHILGKYPSLGDADLDSLSNDYADWFKATRVAEALVKHRGE